MRRSALFRFLSFLFTVVVLSLLFYVDKTTNYTVSKYIGVVKNERHTFTAKTWMKPRSCAEPTKVCSSFQKNPIVILLWENAFGRERDDKFIGCGECLFTTNRENLKGDGVKVVVFHFDEFNRSNLPESRPQNHLYAWWSMESPLALRYRNYFNKSEDFNDIFNFTITYRRDADIYFPYTTSMRTYAKVNRDLRPKTQAELDQLIREKTNIALWVVSNCNVSQGAVDRLKYAKQLMFAGLNLKFGGRCSGNLVREDFNHTKYKFYLAFENSWGCKDYITEKFWKNSLAAGTVPVVIGAPKSDYEAVAPPNSFIYANDYSSPEELVKYLKYLDANDEAYKKYLQWMTLDILDLPGPQHQRNFCSLCLKVKSLKTGDDKKLLPISTTLSRHNFSLESWFYGTENKECLGSFFVNRARMKSSEKVDFAIP